MDLARLGGSSERKGKNRSATSSAPQDMGHEVESTHTMAPALLYARCPWRGHPREAGGLTACASPVNGYNGAKPRVAGMRSHDGPLPMLQESSRGSLATPC